MPRSDFTPGPWHYCGGSIYMRRDVEGYGESCVANMDRENPETSPVERDANARLIASAPSLFSALEGLQREVSSLLAVLGEDEIEDSYAELSAADEVALSAIAQARGES